MRISLVTDEDDLTEPLTLAEAKRQVKLEVAEAHPDDDDISDRLIPAVRERAEVATDRAMVEAVYDVRFDAFPCDGWIEIPKPPLIEVVSVTYVDTAGTTQTWAADQYLVDAPAGPKPQRGRLTPAYGVTWPSTQPQMNAVTVQIRAGYGAVDGPRVPQVLRAAMLLDLSTLYAHREDAYVGAGLSTVIQIPRRSGVIYRSYRSWPRKRS